jgi:hypothetical protein
LVTSFPLRRKIPIWSLFDQMRPICRIPPPQKI